MPQLAVPAVRPASTVRVVEIGLSPGERDQLIPRAKALSWLSSAATAGEGAQNLLGAYLAAGVLIGLLANALFGLWWLDPTVAFAVAALAVWEGREAWQGEGCTCVAVPGLPDDRCARNELVFVPREAPDAAVA